MIIENPTPVTFDAVGWKLMSQANRKRMGTDVQNQETAARFWFSRVEGANLKHCKCLLPGSQVIEDILPTQEEIWVYCDTAGAVLTAFEKFNAEA
jgi:hypothetical protein